MDRDVQKKKDCHISTLQHIHNQVRSFWIHRVRFRKCKNVFFFLIVYNKHKASMIFPFLGKNILYFLKTFGLTSKPSQYLFLFRSIAFFFFFFSVLGVFCFIYIFFYCSFLACPPFLSEVFRWDGVIKYWWDIGRAITDRKGLGNGPSRICASAQSSLDLKVYYYYFIS